MATQQTNGSVPELEINRDAEGLQVDYSEELPDSSRTDGSHNHLHVLEENEEKQVKPNETKPTPSERSAQRQKRARICWVRRRFFFILSIVCILTIACIGAGVGGYYANKNKPPQPTAKYAPPPPPSSLKSHKSH